MGVSRDTLERIKSALDPLLVVREAVPSLKQSGSRWKGNCPFHNERTPSFYFQPEKGLWHCFGACQEGGDILAFVMKLEGLSFAEAIRELAHRTGIALDWDKTDDASSRRAKERDQVFSLLEEAAGFYRDSLRGAADAEVARRYLVQRGILPETAERFRLGFAPRREGFLDVALKKGVTIEVLLRAGLAARSDRTGRYQDPLSGRLIFPIQDPYGQVVAFGGRVLEDDAGPKYLNSPETMVYTKGRHLYGLYPGRGDLRARAQAIIVEGYMDVIGLHQAGATTAVAPLGTALTSEQARLIRRYAQEAVLLFDPDPAGQNASWRSAAVFLKEDVFVRVAQVPGEQDPDEFVRDQGPAALDLLVGKAQDVVDFWLDRLAPALAGFNDLHGRLRRAEELMRFIAGVPNEVLREEWTRRAAARLSLDVDALRREMARQAAKGAGSGRSVSEVAPPFRPQGPHVRTAEEEVLQILAGVGGGWDGTNIPESLFSDTRCLTVFRHWREQMKSRGAVDPAAAVEVLGAADGPWLTGLLLEGKSFDDPSEALARGLRSLAVSAQRRLRAGLEREVLDMLEGRRDRDENKILEYQTLTRLLRAPSPGSSGSSDR
ncbi:MAG: DNA primase [Elusimicrobia bacterium]|nr:DNA primase [Elusimicrobiota bacterium]